MEQPRKRRQDPRHRTADERAQVRALLIRGYSDSRASDATGVPRTTIAEWRTNWADDLVIEQESYLRQASVRIAAKADEITDQALEHLAASDPEAKVKHLGVLNAIAGTHRDKLMAQPIVHQHLHIDEATARLLAERKRQLFQRHQTEQ